MSLISQLDQYSDSFSSNSPSPSITEVCHAAKTLGSKLLLSAPDKNYGISDIYSPLILWQDIFSSFWDNRNFQKQPHLSIQSVFSHLKYIYAKNKWSDIGKFYSLGSLPYAYVIQKFKDLSRKQNIISYFHHPLKQVYFRAAAGLMTCVKALDFFHTNLFNPLQALPIMKLLYLQLNNAFKSETLFLSMAADVKEMYDWLPQHDVIKTIEWVLRQLKWDLEELM